MNFENKSDKRGKGGIDKKNREKNIFKTVFSGFVYVQKNKRIHAFTYVAVHILTDRTETKYKTICTKYKF